MNKNIFTYPLIFILFVIIVSTAVPGYGVASSLEKGSFITEVEGMAYFSEDKTLRQTRLEAEMDAKRKAVGIVGDQKRFLNLGKQGLEVVGDQYRGLAVFNNSKKITEFYEASLDVFTRSYGGP